MKKEYILIIIIVLLIALLKIVVMKPHIYEIGDSIETQDMKITLKSAELSKKLTKGGLHNSFLPIDSNTSGRYKEAGKNHIFVTFSINIKNTSKKEIHLEDEFTSNNIIIKYKSKKYHTNSSKNKSQKNCGNTCYNSGYMVWQNKEGIDQFKSFNYIDFNLKSNEELNLRIYLDLPINVKNNNNPFYLIFKFDTGDYIYKIN